MNIRQADGKFTLTGSTLKIIALICMVIDHSAVGLVSHIEGFQTSGTPLHTVYMIMRGIGRCAFPLFCFLLVEGVLHTSDIKKYALRMLLFSLISEIPFDLIRSEKVFDMQHQNVFWTLFLGVVMLGIFRYLEQIKGSKLPEWGRMILMAVVLISMMFIADLIHSDYKSAGILVIAVMYLLRNQRLIQMTLACFILMILSSDLEVVALITVPLVALYNGDRGLNLKYIFYAAYPVHLLVIYFIAFLLKLK